MTHAEREYAVRESRTPWRTYIGACLVSAGITGAFVYYMATTPRTTTAAPARPIASQPPELRGPAAATAGDPEPDAAERASSLAAARAELDAAHDEMARTDAEVIRMMIEKQMPRARENARAAGIEVTRAVDAQLRAEGEVWARNWVKMSRELTAVCLAMSRKEPARAKEYEAAVHALMKEFYTTPEEILGRGETYQTALIAARAR